MFGTSHPWEMMMVMVIALLLFGKRLPEVARSLGKGIIEFKKGLKGIEEEVTATAYRNPTASAAPAPTPGRRPEPLEETTQDWAPKFELPSSAPVAASENKDA